MSKQKNVIVIVSDTFRRDYLGVYGNDWISTPNIDRFAKDSLVFDNAFTGSFPTVPNRHDIFAGNFTASYIPWRPLPAEETVLAQVLSDSGYTTMMIADTPHILENGYYYNRGFTSWDWIRGQESDNIRYGEYHWRAQPNRLRHYGKYPHFINRGYWRYEEDRFVAKTAQSAMRWLEDYTRMPTVKRSPFFLYVDTFDPHEPWDAPDWMVEKYYPDYDGEIVDYPHYWFTDGYLSDEELRYCKALYAGEVTLVDRWMGRLMQKIDDMGLLDDTIVLFTADHGFLLGEYGIIGKAIISPDSNSSYISLIPMFEEIARIPLIAHVPGGISGTTPARVQPPDLAPTILDMTGIEKPKEFKGKSFSGVLKGETDTHRDTIFTFPYLGDGRSGATAITDKHLVYIAPPNPTNAESVSYAVDGIKKKQLNIDEVSSELLKQWERAFVHADRQMVKGYIERFKSVVSEHQIYELSGAGGERKNLAAEYPEMIDELRLQFFEFLKLNNGSKETLEFWHG